MMRLSPRKKDIEAIVAQLDAAEHDTPEGLAGALWDTITELVQERGKYTVVGQLHYSGPAGGYVNADDAKAHKVCLGLYATEGDARTAARSMAVSASTWEEWRCWVLPVEHSAPAEVHRKRAEAHKAAVAAEKTGRTIPGGEAA